MLHVNNPYLTLNLPVETVLGHTEPVLCLKKVGSLGPGGFWGYSPPLVDRIWGIWGYLDNLPKAIFSLLQGDYRSLGLGFRI